MYGFGCPPPTEEKASADPYVVVLEEVFLEQVPTNLLPELPLENPIMVKLNDGSTVPAIPVRAVYYAWVEIIHLDLAKEGDHGACYEIAYTLLVGYERIEGCETPPAPKKSTEI